MSRTIGVVFCSLAIFGCDFVRAEQRCGAEWRRPIAAPAPADNPARARHAALGQMLFFDTRLSAKQSMSCASCHNPALGWSDGRATAVGHDGKILPRATPTILNAAFNPLQMWDGRKTSLEDQALAPFGADEQNLPIDELERRVRSIPGYRALFDQSYPGEGVSPATIAKAIASFERTVLSTESPFDRWCAGQSAALSAGAERGFALFRGKARCALCHHGFGMSDGGFHNIGLAKRRGVKDVGRFTQVPIRSAKGAFKTPTLRDVALTAPYMHDGRYGTLEEVIDHYDRGGDADENRSPDIAVLNLSSGEKRNLVEFLLSLTGKPDRITVPRLPPSNGGLE